MGRALVPLESKKILGISLSRDSEGGVKSGKVRAPRPRGLAIANYGGSLPRIWYPAVVRGQTTQSGLIGFAIHDSAQPLAIQASMVLRGTPRPSRSNSGSFPPGSVSPRSR